MLPLLLIFTAFESLVKTRFYPSALPDIGLFARIAPLSASFHGRRPLGWNDLAGGKKPPKIGMFHEKVGVVL
jgi:hypothetical protein